MMTTRQALRILRSALAADRADGHRGMYDMPPRLLAAWEDLPGWRVYRQADGKGHVLLGCWRASREAGGPVYVL